MSGHVFVSHGSEDSQQANDLTAFIESKGVKAWIAPRDVRPGQDYSEQLQEAIEQCIAFVVLVTDKANSSPYVRAETEMAFSTSKPIFPVRMSDIQPAAGLAFFLKIRHWTDAFGPGRDASLDRLARELQTLAGVADPPPAPTPATGPPPTPVSPAPPRPEPAAGPPPLSAAPAAAMAMPAGAPPAPPPSIGDVDRALLDKAVGPKAAWYVGRWQQIEAKGSAINWNWAACLANIFWFAYRKMWLPMFLMLLAIVVLAGIGSTGPDAGRITLLLNIALTFVTGSIGNNLYRKQTLRLVAETSALGRAAQLEALEKRGGVSKPALWISIAIVVLFGLLVALAAIGQAEQERRARQQLDNMMRIQAADPNGPADPALGEKPPAAEEPPPADYPDGY